MARTTSILCRATPKLFTSRRTIPGWFTDIPSWHGRGGTRTPESGLAVRTFRSGSASESAGSAALDGAGAIGASIGTADIQFMAAPGTTRAAAYFTTGTLFTGEGRVPEFITVLAQCPDPSTETARLREGTLHLAVRAVSAPVAPSVVTTAGVKAASAPEPSAATTTGERPGAFRRAETPASAAGFMGAVAATAVVVEDVGNRSFVMFGSL